MAVLGPVDATGRVRHSVRRTTPAVVFAAGRVGGRAVSIVSLASLLVVVAGQASGQVPPPPPVQVSPPAEAPVPLITDPAWLVGPETFDLAPFYPKENTRDAARVEAECGVLPDGRLTQCQLLGDPAAARPFMLASLRAIVNFRLPPSLPPPDLDPAAAPTASPSVARVRFALEWAAPADPATYDRLIRATISDPANWQYGGGDYPERAQSRGIESGRVGVMCVARATGRLEACSVMEENPPGVGFGSAALRTMRRKQLSPSTLDGEPIDDIVFNHVNFRLEDPPPQVPPPEQ